LAFLADADIASIVLGTRVPIVLTDPTDSPRTRLASVALAVVLATHQGLLTPITTP
jgi:phosphotransacetylase